MKPIVLYDLCPYPNGPYYAPNPYKTRLSLMHKGVEFVTKAVTMRDLRDMAKKLGGPKLLVPTIELPSGELISDSWKIAEWLEVNYPDKPSLFLPASKTPVNQNSPEMQVAKNFAFLFTEGFGSSDAQWSTFFELSAEGIANMQTGDESDPSSDLAYFKSDEKLGIKDGWAFLHSTPKATLIARAQASLNPLENLLTQRDQLFLTSATEPGFVDYVAYGRYAMMRLATPEICEQVWGQRKAIKAWVERIEERFGKGEEGLKKVMARK